MGAVPAHRAVSTQRRRGWWRRGRGSSPASWEAAPPRRAPRQATAAPGTIGVAAPGAIGVAGIAAIGAIDVASIVAMVSMAGLCDSCGPLVVSEHDEQRVALGAWYGWTKRLRLRGEPKGGGFGSSLEGTQQGTGHGAAALQPQRGEALMCAEHVPPSARAPGGRLESVWRAQAKHAKEQPPFRPR
eukprot:scaffold82731_cov68-Phaeocystis_antarctica.AAC.2